MRERSSLLSSAMMALRGAASDLSHASAWNRAPSKHEQMPPLQRSAVSRLRPLLSQANEVQRQKERQKDTTSPANNTAFAQSFFHKAKCRTHCIPTML